MNDETIKPPQIAEEEINTSPVSWVVHTAVTVAILLIAFSVVGAMFANKPEARKFGSRPPPAVGVETTQLQATDYSVWIDSYGIAQPLTQTQLVSDVSGRVIEVSPKIRAGESFQAGEVLLKLEEQDYKIEVDVAKATVVDAQFKYTQELAEAALAEKDWNIRPGDPEARELALRKPQVAAALAALGAAEARLQKAELDLARTEIRAPFAGKVLRQMVDLGQVVNSSQAIADIYATEEIEVRLPVKAQDLASLRLPQDISLNADLPKVVFESELGHQTFQWQGELVRSEGAFDTQTRLLYVVARIKDPFTATDMNPALRVGQFLRAKIQGVQLENVYVVPRRAVTQDNKIAIAEEGMLRKRQVQPLWTDAQSVVIAAEMNAANAASPVLALKADDALILTPTANLIDGTRVRSLGDKADGQVAQKAAAVDKAIADSGTTESNNQPQQKSTTQIPPQTPNTGKSVTSGGR